MEKVYNFLNKAKVNFIATLTISSDKPNNRPFGEPTLFNNKIYCFTNKTKTVYKEISANHNVCIVAIDTNNKWLRIHAKLIDDSTNIAAKKAIITKFPWTISAGYTLDNPNFATLYLAEATATISDVNGKVLSQYKF